MTDSAHFGFAKLVPGVDFLQNPPQGTAQTLPQLPSLSRWAPPHMEVEESEKPTQDYHAPPFRV